MTTAELLAKYPYVPGSNAWDYPWGSPERLRGVPPEGGLREALAGFYLACEARWANEEVGRRAKELGRIHQPATAASYREPDR